MIESFLNSGVDRKKCLYAINLLSSYLKKDLEKAWKKVDRKTIHDVSGKNACFRTFLNDNVKNNASKNNVIRSLERFFDFMIMTEMSYGVEGLINPVSFLYDKFKEKIKHSSTRGNLDYSVIKEIKRILSENDFAFYKKHFGENCLSPAYILFVMMTIPLRAIQAQYLDSGLLDEYLYDFNTREMVKNIEGLKGRREGFVTKTFYNGIKRDKYECLYINTNKSSNGFFIPYINSDLLNIVSTQREIVRSLNILSVKKEYGLLKSKDVHLLFPDFKTGKVVSKRVIMKLWTLLCEEVQKTMDVNLTYLDNGTVKTVYDLHSLRVSLVSHAVQSGVDFRTVGKSYSGQDNNIVLYYSKINNLKDIVSERQEQKQIGLMKLIGDKNGKY